MTESSAPSITQKSSPLFLARPESKGSYGNGETNCSTKGSLPPAHSPRVCVSHDGVGLFSILAAAPHHPAVQLLLDDRDATRPSSKLRHPLLFGSSRSCWCTPLTRLHVLVEKLKPQFKGGQIHRHIVFSFRAFRVMDACTLLVKEAHHLRLYPLTKCKHRYWTIPGLPIEQ